MLLRITRNSDSEWVPAAIPLATAYMGNQLISMLKPILSRLEEAFALRWISPKRDKIPNTQRIDFIDDPVQIGARRADTGEMAGGGQPEVGLDQ